MHVIIILCGVKPVSNDNDDDDDDDNDSVDDGDVDDENSKAVRIIRNY